jgi:hypothetical protein
MYLISFHSGLIVIGPARKSWILIGWISVTLADLTDKITARLGFMASCAPDVTRGKGPSLTP